MDHLTRDIGLEESSEQVEQEQEETEEKRIESLAEFQKCFVWQPIRQRAALEKGPWPIRLYGPIQADKKRQPKRFVAWPT